MRKIWRKIGFLISNISIRMALSRQDNNKYREPKKAYYTGSKYQI